MTHAPPLPSAPTPHRRGQHAPPPTWHAAGIVIAAPSRRFACWTVNVAVIALTAGTGWAFGWAWGLVFGIAMLAGEANGLRRTGRSVGHRVAGLRVVTKATGMPGALGAALPRRCITTDLRKGRDPLALTPRPIPGLTSTPPPPPPSPARVGTWTVIADDGSRFVIPTPTLVGRKADDPSGRYACATIPDVSKTLSRNHALLAPAPDGLRVTDVGSGNGSAIAERDRLHRIGKYQTVTVPPGARLMLGTRFFEVTYE